MDTGRSACLMLKYAKEHAAAKNTVRNNKWIDRIRDRNALLKLSVSELRDHGYTACDIANSGVPWDTLQKKYGMDALVSFGLGWEHMVRGGIRPDQACAAGVDTLTRLGVNARKLMELQPSVSDVVHLSASPQQLVDFGMTPRMLRAIGLDMRNMCPFGYTIAQWRDVIGLDKWDELGFISYDECEQHGWTRKALRSVLDEG